MAGRQQSVKEEKVVVIALTPSITVQLDSVLDQRWKATCPLDKESGRKQWKAYAPTRTEAERLLANHLDTHTHTQGAFL